MAKMFRILTLDVRRFKENHAKMSYVIYGRSLSTEAQGGFGGIPVCSVLMFLLDDMDSSAIALKGYMM